MFQSRLTNWIARSGPSCSRSESLIGQGNDVYLGNSFHWDEGPRVAVGGVGYEQFGLPVTPYCNGKRRELT